MDKKSLSAGLLILSVGVTEVGEARERILDAGSADRTMDSAISGSLRLPPHSHLEPFDDSLPTTVNEIFASGGQASLEKSRLHVVPLGSGFRLVGYPFASPAGDRQLMYGFCENVDSLCALLTSELAMLPQQIQAVRRIALQGTVQEIGGHRHSATRLFSRAALEGIGMTFRLPDVQRVAALLRFPNLPSIPSGSFRKSL
jgi:hypothetical protein